MTADKARIERSLFIEGRLWFDKINGNTYYSNRIWVDGKIAFTMGMAYGYEEMYLHAAIQELYSRDYLTGDKVPTVSELRDELGIDVYRSANYGNKRELFKGDK
jgi:hypothetical protein